MIKFNKFISELSNSLKQLPGMEAQLKMAPITRIQELQNLQKQDEPRKSAVLALFYPSDESIKLVFIKRPVDDTVHSGQIAFPGGRYEEEDENMEATAIRESWEEVGLEPKLVNIIGNLSKLYIPPSNYDVFPFVGYTKEKPNFVCNDEVDLLLEFDFEELSMPSTLTKKDIHTRQGKTVEVPCFIIDGHIIWGATAMIVSELLSITKKIKF